MAWINADDRYEPGAFVTVAEIFKNHSNIDWVTGRPTVINEAGEMLDISPIIPFPRKAIAAGIFEGRFARPFIQQEGTFWRPGLWEKAGGLNANFRFAGDFDLWRRFATRTDLVIVNAILGCFRFRAGQLSSDMTRYYAEIDSSLSPEEVEARAKASKRYAKAGFEYRVLAAPLRRAMGVRALADVRIAISRHQGVQGGTLASQPPGAVQQGAGRIKERLTNEETRRYVLPPCREVERSLLMMPDTGSAKPLSTNPKRYPKA